MSQRPLPADLFKSSRPSLPGQPSSKPIPLPLDADLLRHISGGNNSPKRGW